MWSLDTDLVELGWLFDHKQTAVFSLSVHVVRICASSKVFSPVSNQGPFCIRWTCAGYPHAENYYCDKALDPQAFWRLWVLYFHSIFSIVSGSNPWKNKEHVTKMAPRHVYTHTHMQSHPCIERHVCVSISPVSQISPGSLRDEAWTCSSLGSRQHYGNTNLFTAAERRSNFEICKTNRFLLRIICTSFTLLSPFQDLGLHGCALLVRGPIAAQLNWYPRFYSCTHTETLNLCIWSNRSMRFIEAPGDSWCYHVKIWSCHDVCYC